MSRTLPLLFLFSVTATLLLLSSSHVNFNTWSVFKGKKHSNSSSATVKGSKGRHLKVDYIFTACDDSKKCNSSVVTRSPGSDSESANVTRLIYGSMKLSPAPSQAVATANGSITATSRTPAPPSTVQYILPMTPPPPSTQTNTNTTININTNSTTNTNTTIYTNTNSTTNTNTTINTNTNSTTNITINTNTNSITNTSIPKPAPLAFLSPSPSPTPGNLSWKTKIIIGIAIVVVIALLTCIMIYGFKYKRLTRPIKFCLTTKSDRDIEASIQENGAPTLKRFKYSDVKKMTKSFYIELGKGGFGTVYKGELLGRPVAVKILNASKANGKGFINEVTSISRTSHVNVVQLLGFCLESNNKALIYEFMFNGSLDKFIYNKGLESTPSLSWDNLWQIAIGIARGLEYLHRGCNTQILHFDIKPHNILLDENFHPKISDFGLAKLCPAEESTILMSDQRGTTGYKAPEVWNRHFGGVSHKSDVYSYGMMLLEMVGGRKNINAEASHASEIYFPYWVHNRLEQGSDLRPKEVMATKENEIARRMTVVGLWCVQTIPQDRPTMSTVIDMLEGNINSLEIPPKPILSSPTRSVPESPTT